MCASCNDPIGFGRFRSDPPPHCSRCRNLCDKQIGALAAVHYLVKGFNKLCARCYLLVTEHKTRATGEN